MEPLFNINPEDAQADMDALTLNSYSITEQLLVFPDQEVTPTAGRTITVRLSDGLGRITTAESNIVQVDVIESLQVEAFFSGITPDQSVALGDLFDRWVEVSIPLRFLDFGTHTILMEDEGSFVGFPVGRVNIQARTNSDG